MIPRQSQTQYFHGEGETMEAQSLPTAVKVALVVKVGMWLLLTGIGDTLPVPKCKVTHGRRKWNK